MLTIAAPAGVEQRVIAGHHVIVIKRQNQEAWKVVLSGSWIGMPAGMEGMQH